MVPPIIYGMYGATHHPLVMYGATHHPLDGRFAELYPLTTRFLGDFHAAVTSN